MDKKWDPTLVSQVQDLARAYTQRRRRSEMTHIDWEAVEMAAVCGGLDAIDTYEAGHNTKLSSWMVTKIKAAILQELRKQDYLSRYQRDRVREQTERTGEEPAWAKPCVSLDDLKLGDTEEMLLAAVEDRSEGPDAVVDRLMGAAWVRSLLRYLPERHAQVIQLKFLDQLSHTEAALRLNVSQRHLCTLQREALDRLRYLLEGLKERDALW